MGGNLKMVKHVFYTILTVVLLSILAACAKATVMKSTGNSPPVAVIITAWTARTEGKLSFDGQCLRVKTSGQINLLLLWPPDFNVTIEGNTLHVITGMITGTRNEADFKVGDNVILGGGIPDGPIDPSFYQVSSTMCFGPYWVVGDIEK